MSKKILVISGSPRKGGNSDMLCDEFIKGALEAGHETEKIFLGKKNISYCCGCGTCNTSHVCVIKDDMSDILPKLVNADVVVMATPVYFYSMDAQMKTLIDRTTPRYEEIKNKEFYFIVTAADTDKKMMRRTIEGFRAFTQDCLDGAKEKGIIYGTGAWHAGEIKETPAMKEAYETGKSV